MRDTASCRSSAAAPLPHRAPPLFISTEAGSRANLFAEDEDEGGSAAGVGGGGGGEGEVKPVRGGAEDPSSPPRLPAIGSSHSLSAEDAFDQQQLERHKALEEAMKDRLTDVASTLTQAERVRRKAANQSKGILQALLDARTKCGGSSTRRRSLADAITMLPGDARRSRPGASM